MARKGVVHILQMHDTTRRILMIIGVILVVGGLLLLAYSRREGAVGDGEKESAWATCMKGCTWFHMSPKFCKPFCKRKLARDANALRRQ